MTLRQTGLRAALLLLVALFAVVGCASSPTEEPTPTVSEPTSTEAAQMDWADVAQVENPRSGVYPARSFTPVGSMGVPEPLSVVGAHCAMVAGDLIREIGTHESNVVVRISTPEGVEPETDRGYCGSGVTALMPGDTFDRLLSSPDELVQAVTERHDAVGAIVQNPVERPRTMQVPKSPYWFGYGATPNGVRKELNKRPPLATIREYFKTSRLCYVSQGQSITELGEYNGEVLVRYDTTEVTEHPSCEDNTIFFVAPDVLPTNGDVDNDIAWG